MGKYIGQRMVALVVILFTVSIFAFLLIHLLPGNPAVVALGTGATPQNVAIFKHRYGLDKSLFEQYGIWMSHVLRGDLGTSFISYTTVNSSIGQALPVDLVLVAISQVMALGLAIPLAFRCARKPGGILDKIITTTTFVGLSLPAFVVIVLLVLVVAIHWSWTSLAPYQYAIGGGLWHNFLALLLGALTLAIGSFVVYFRILRSDLIATYQEEFIVMARSKGLSRRRILWRHAFRPSSISLLATAGINVSGLISGTFIVELLLGIPGLGKQLIFATFSTDYLLVQGIVLVVATLTVVLNFTIDVLFGLVDPRISRD